MAGKRCEHPGCRAWAMRGQATCIAHRGRRDLTPATPPSTFTSGVLAGHRDGLVDDRILSLIAEAGENGEIGTELGALRLLLMRAVAEASLTGDLSATALTVVRLTDAIGRLLKVRHSLAGGRPSLLEESLTQVLIQMGMDDPDGEPVEAYPPPEGGFATALEARDEPE